MNLLDTSIHLLEWEGGGSTRFACILEDSTTSGGKRVAFFETRVDPVIQAKKVAEFPVPSWGPPINFYWAPNGQYFVLASLGSEGDLLFGHLNLECKPDILHKDSHPQATMVSWDPSSRYVVTAVTVPHEDNPADASFLYVRFSEMGSYR
eukprot:Platyproteum_vivax@DN10896_c0_g1_i1.p1